MKQTPIKIQPASGLQGAMCPHCPLCRAELEGEVQNLNLPFHSRSFIVLYHNSYHVPRVNGRLNSPYRP